MKKDNITHPNQSDFYSMDDFDSDTRNKLKSIKKRHWVYIVYPESAPEDWIEVLKDTLVPFAVSPLHDQDVDIVGNLKKPHWHLIVSFDGPTTFNCAASYCEITKGPLPKACGSLKGAYEYFTHKNSLDKYHYSSTEIQEYNGFVVEVTNNESMKINKELAKLIYAENIIEITELECLIRNYYGDEYYVAFVRNAYYFNMLIKSLRHNPERRRKKMKRKINQNNQFKNIEENMEEIDNESCSE